MKPQKYKPRKPKTMKHFLNKSMTAFLGLLFYLQIAFYLNVALYLFGLFYFLNLNPIYWNMYVRGGISAVNVLVAIIVVTSYTEGMKEATKNPLNPVKQS